MTDKLPSDMNYNLEFTVPIFDVNYIGENKSSQDMWNNSIDFFGNIKDYCIDSKTNIYLKQFNYFTFSNYGDLKTDVLSQLDIEYLGRAEFAFVFECKKDELEDYKQKLILLLLAARISKQSDLSIKYIICKNPPQFSLKYSDNWKYAISAIRIKSERQELNKFDLDKVVLTYKQLQEFFKISSRTTHAVNFLFLAYTSYYWMEAFMLLMTALETLVSPDERGAIVKPITSRVVSLINDKNICSRTKFEKIYDLRSDIIHGKILVDINFEKELPRLQQLEKIVLAIFKVLLEKDYKNIY
ncbi:MAG: HEPN domain-containing protein, partial [Ignavibacteria bacterium]|nr:HEPN domain-containing protein [Ignavibacteria bacterium]